MFDNTSAWGPGKAGMNVKFIGDSIERANGGYSKIFPLIFAEAEKLINSYRDVLDEEHITKANCLCWGLKSVEEYKHSFLVNVLMDYKIWEISDAEYEKLCKAIEQNNPEWLSRFLNDAERRKNRIKVSV